MIFPGRKSFIVSRGDDDRPIKGRVGRSRADQREGRTVLVHKAVFRAAFERKRIVFKVLSSDLLESPYIYKVCCCPQGKSEWLVHPGWGTGGLRTEGGGES